MMEENGGEDAEKHQTQIWKLWYANMHMFMLNI